MLQNIAIKGLIPRRLPSAIEPSRHPSVCMDESNLKIVKNQATGFAIDDSLTFFIPKSFFKGFLILQCMGVGDAHSLEGLCNEIVQI